MTQLGGVASANAISVDVQTRRHSMRVPRRRCIAPVTLRRSDVRFLFSGHATRSVHLGRDVVALRDIAAKIGTIGAAFKLANCRCVSQLGHATERSECRARLRDFVVAPPEAKGVACSRHCRWRRPAQDPMNWEGAIFTHFGHRFCAVPRFERRLARDFGESYDFAYSQTFLTDPRVDPA